MTKPAFSVPRYPVWPTVLILTVGAMVGVFIGGILFFIALNLATVVGGPVVWLIMMPLMLASFGLSMTAALVITPLWALCGGWLFSRMASGQTGSLARLFGVTFFSDEHPVFQVTQRMAGQLGIPPVAYVCWYESDDINAFTTGTHAENTMVAVSKGAVEKLTKDQLDAILAHELGHIASNDVGRMTYAHGLRDALTFFLMFRSIKQIARWLFTPLSELELLRFSRAREYRADATAAYLTSPESVISALESIRDQAAPPQTQGVPTMMLYAGLSSGSLLSTHPPLEDRIRALRDIAQDRHAIPPPDVVREVVETIPSEDVAKDVEAVFRGGNLTVPNFDVAAIVLPKSSQEVVLSAIIVIVIASLVVMAMPHFGFVSFVLLFLLGGFLADMLTAILHFALEYAVSDTTPVIGPFAREFRAHLVAPRRAPSKLLENLTRGAYLSLPFSILGLLISLSGGADWGSFLVGGTMVSMSIWLLWCYQIHAYAHISAYYAGTDLQARATEIFALEDTTEQVRRYNKLADTTDIPPVIRLLQRSNLLLNPAVHALHHIRRDTYFSGVNGWSNRITAPIFQKAALYFQEQRATS
jgi:heat shock protein HtpX